MFIQTDIGYVHTDYRNAWYTMNIKLNNQNTILSDVSMSK